MRRSSCTIYVGNLPGDIRESEIEDLFEKYGPIVDIDLKLPPRPPGYCFIQFEDYRDAEDAIRGRDGYKFDGYRLRVEPAHGGRGSSVDTYGSYGGGGYSTNSYRRSRYRVVVYGLPSSASWQDLKDHMRRAGDVCFAQVYREGRDTIGVVEYTTYDDMRYAIKRLDDSEFRNPFSRSYIRVKEDRGYSRGRSYSRSPSYDYYRKGYRGRSYSRSYSRSPSYDSRRSPSQSYSRSPSVYSHSRSPSRSVSRSPVPLRPSKRSSYARSISPSRSPSISRSKSRSHKKSLSRRSRSRSMSRSPSPSGPYYRSRSRSYSPPRRLLDDVRRRSPSSDRSVRSSSPSSDHGAD